MKRKILTVLLATLLVVAVIIPCLANTAPDNYPYVKDGKIDPAGYFALEGAEVAVVEEGLVFTMTNDTAKITFNKPLAADGFQMVWNGHKAAKKHLEKMVITIADIQNPECALRVNVEKVNNTASSIKINDEKLAYLTQGSLYNENERDMKIIYSAIDSTISDGDTTKISVRQTANGDSFNGFAGLAVDLTVELQGKAGAAFCLKSLNGQRFGSAYLNDNMEPILCLPQFSRKVLYNSVFQLPQVDGYDVLATDVEMKLTVNNPEGEVVKDVDGNLLENVDGRGEYKIKLDMFGDYRVNYVLSDGTNQTLPMGYRLTVADEGAPAMELSEQLKVLTVGEEYVLPVATVTDNSGAQFISWINVRHPDGTITCEVEKFTPQEGGIYTITYTAMDEFGNITRVTVETYAKEAGR